MPVQHHDPAIPRLVLDVETFSELDLARVGAHAYAEHPSTGVHCVAWNIRGGNQNTGTRLWLPGQPCPREIRGHLWADLPPNSVVAHNWLFEFNIMALLVFQHGWSAGLLDPSRWSCTMARSLYHGLPASLEMLGEALALPVRKDPAARRNMLALSRPRRSKNGTTTWWKDDPVKGLPMLQALYDYCRQDVDAEVAADEALPELPDNAPLSERQVFMMDGRMNQRGVAIDLQLIEKMREVTATEGARLNADMARLTGDTVKSTNQVAAIQTFLARRSCYPNDLTKGGVAEALERLPPGADDVSRAVLLTRQEAATAATAKLGAMARAVSRDGRARGTFQYGGAGRTMRWAGRRSQLQNYPRPAPGMDKAAIESAVRSLLAGSRGVGFRLLYPGTPMDVLASCLRACIVAADGCLLVVPDFAQIEARVIAWLAGQDDILAVFAAGDDVYTYTAARLGSPSRQLGKVLVLACGFGMGWQKFQATALTYGLVLTDEEAQDAVTGWREQSTKIVAYWYALGRAFIQVAQGVSGTKATVGQGQAAVELRKAGFAVRIKLPSGRDMIYQQVEIHQDDLGRPEITYMGVHQQTKKWVRLRTYGGKLAENITQAVARDALADAKLRIKAQLGMDPIGTVHDEPIYEAPAHLAPQALHNVLHIMRTPPSWARTLPVHAEGWTGRRYRK